MRTLGGIASSETGLALRPDWLSSIFGAVGHTFFGYCADSWFVAVLIFSRLPGGEYD